MSNLQEKLNETIEAHSNVLKKIAQTEDSLQQLRGQLDQLLGRAQTLQELLREESEVATEDDE